GPYTTIKLSNGFSDPSFIRETLGYEIARKYMPASRANYANVYVNDTLIGVYTSVQSVDDYFGEEHLYTGELARIKGSNDNMNLWTIWGYINSNPASYANFYELDSGESMDSFISFLNIFNNSPAQMETVFNVDRHLWNIAFDWLFVNLDAPVNFGHNYYLYEDSTHRFNTILWDLNMCFGGFQRLITGANLTVTQMQNLDPMTHSAHNSYPILNKVLSNPMFKRMYIAHMRTMLEENITNGWYSTRGTELQSIVGASVQADPNYFYSYANFLANLNNAVSGGGPGGPGFQTTPGITQLMNARATYLLAHNAFQGTIPSITSINHFPEDIQPLSDVNFTVHAIDALNVYLGWRQNPMQPFIRTQMYDDGMHNDGVAGDGIFGLTIPAGYGNIQYYIYAENASQGKFLPPRAEYEFFTIPVASNTGEILINEIMAKNASFADPYGEFDDWVELYNPNDYPVNIAGMYMTDNHYSNGVSAWTQIPYTHPEITTIPPHGYLIVWFDEDMDQGPLHINDKLGGAADAVYLISSDGSTIIDSFSWLEATGLNTDDVSIGRYPDGSESWQLFGFGQNQPCTPGTSNNAGFNYPPVISDIQYTPYPT
ncbi:MAG: CotH kinase family protein, partial [Candidatus Cloacimonadaceae bacterium]|nr:CotH kinase family protein [Candidatus Cloacimonadaceae bacterium]